MTWISLDRNSHERADADDACWKPAAPEWLVKKDVMLCQRAAARPIEEDLACRGALSREDDADGAGGAHAGCSVTAPMAREVGAGQAKTQAAVGGKVEMLSMRQTSSSCRVSTGCKANPS